MTDVNMLVAPVSASSFTCKVTEVEGYHSISCYML